MSYSYINGHIVASEDARISIQDRGFRFGDGVFETIAVKDGIPYQWELHMQRLTAGLKTLRIHADTGTLRSAALLLLASNRVSKGFLRIAITRGQGSRGYLPLKDTHPTIAIETLSEKPRPDAISLHLSSLTVIPPEYAPAQAKSMNSLPYILAQMEAQDHACFDALMLDKDGYIGECASANIFWVKGGEVFTPATGSGILNGTIRQAALRLCGAYAHEGHFTLADLKGAEEVFITNVALLATPVIALPAVGGIWRIGEVTRTLQQRLEEDMTRYAGAHNA